MRILCPRLALPATLATLAAVTGCIPQPPTVPAPARQPMATPPAPAPVARPALAPDWRDWPMTAGTWVYRQDARGSIALFGPANAAALVTMRCDSAARRISIARAGTKTGAMTIRTTSTSRVLPVQSTGGTPAYVAAALDARDPLLEAIGFSRGRFTIEQAGAAPLVIPPWAEVERVTQDCRG